MRGSSGQRNEGWWISPAVPTIANAVLGALWGFSAFCTSDSALNMGCSGRFDTAVAVSVVPAFLALALVVVSWASPAIRRDQHLLDALLSIAAFTWLLAEGVLFIGGWIAQS